MSKESGFILLISIFAIALGSVLLGGFLMIVASTLQIARYHAWSEEALYVAEAGLQSSIAQLQQNSQWNTGFSNQPFPAGSGNVYTVTVANAYPVATLNVTATVHGSYTRRILAKVMVTGAPQATPYTVRIDTWKEW